MKENDIILNMLANQNFTLADFQSVGLNGDNTGLRSEDEYLKSDKIRSNELFINKDTGEFDETLFHKFYIGAGQWYNQLTTLDHEQELAKQAQFGKGNMWVDADKRTIDFSPKLVRTTNEHLVTNSLESIGKRGQRTLSQSEIAQTQKVYDVKTGEWRDSPNDSFFDNIGTLVLATYDKDEFDDEGKLIHQKGERKLNEEGLPYYETLGGRDVYGKQVLSKFNMLTTDGSFMNKFDFFDTDDLEQKSTVGTIMRNAALVGSMFIPYVGPWIAGLSVATQASGLLATLGKLFVGNENETLNEIQAWAKTVNRQGQTEYAAKNTWCVENFINMIGDTIGQLKEQRWIFKSVPKAFGHTKAVKAMSGEKGYNAVVKEVEEELAKKGYLNTTKNLIDDVAKTGNPTKLSELTSIAKAFEEQNRKKAIGYVDDLIKQANDIGSPISKAYMTALVVQDTYGEAKAAGASDLEAMLLTLGYAAGEAAILNSPLGEWVLPELKGTQLKHKAIANAVGKQVKEAYGELAKTGSKKAFTSKLLDIGKKIQEGVHAERLLSGSKALSTVAASGLTESAEEVTEELWSDISKSLFNTYRWLSNQETLELGAWENTFDRYAMSALGGFVGGGITSAATDFKQARDLAKMDQTQAMHELLYMVNNGKEKEFLESLDKMSLGNKNLSASKIIDVDSEGHVIYGEGSKDDNQDLEIKNLIKGKIKLIKDILDSEGARISKESLLNRLTLEDQNDIRKHMRYGALQNTHSMTMYIEDFANIQSKIVKTKSELMSLTDGKIDSDKSVDINIEDRRKQLEKELKELQEKKDAYKTGKIAPEAIRDAIFEMNPILNQLFTKTNLKLYAEAKLNKKWTDMSDQEKKDISEQYKKYSETSMKNDIHTGAIIFQNMMELYTPVAQEAQNFALEQKTKGKAYTAIQKFISELYANRWDQSVDQDTYLETLQNQLNSQVINFSAILGKDFLSQDVINKLKQIETDPNLNSDVKSKLYINTLFDNVADTLFKQSEDIIKLGHVHPEIKNALIETLNTTKQALTDYVFNQDVEDPTLYFSELYNNPDLEFTEMQDLYTDKTNQTLERFDKIDKLIEQLQELSNTPIIDYLNQFSLSTTNSDLNISKHLQKVTDLLNNSKNSNLDELILSEEFLEDNEEALLLLDSFAAVMEGLKIDNADITNPTGYSKMLNEVYQKQGIQNYTKLAEIDSETADIILQDITLLRNKLQFAEDIHKINKGQKLRQHNVVNVNKNYLIYNTLKNRFINVLPDKWIAKDGSSAKDYLQSVINKQNELKNISQDNLKLNKEQRKQANKELTEISNAIYEIFQLNKKGDSWDKNELKELINSFAGTNGFFQKTGGELDEHTKFLDDNSFIWWIASKALVKQSDFDGAYLKSLNDDLAPIPSQELAVQLGVAAIVNSDGLNTFVDAYRETMIETFKNISDENERIKLLKNFDSSTEIFANKLLKYFASYDAVPQYHNMIFIEGIPGSGKSGGVFKSIKAVMDQIDPNWMDNAIYAHVKQTSAEEAGKKIGLNNGQYFAKKSLLEFISPDWKDISKNADNKDGKQFLYKDSYEFDSEGKLINKWKVNKLTNAPKVMFIDEISHYNQQELSIIEQFAKLNGIVVLTAGDFDQDTATAFLNVDGETVSVASNRNNFVRSFKLGLTLRTLNRQMTHDITIMRAAINNIKENKEVPEIKFSYLEDHPKEKGLFGVKTTSSFNDNTKQTIQIMMDTTKDKIGYIYHDENTELYKYLSENFKDKINFYKDSDAQGLEGQYYIVENSLKHNVPGGASQVSQTRTLQYARSLYTGISRAEQGVLAIVPSGEFGLIKNIDSIKDPTYHAESISKESIKKASRERHDELEELSKEFNSNQITIIPPSQTKTTTTTPTTPTAPKPGGLPPTLPPPTPAPTKIGSGYTTRAEAQSEITYLNSQINSLNNPIAINKASNEEFEIVGTNVTTLTNSNGVKIFVPVVKLSNGTDVEISVDEFKSDYLLKDKVTNTIPMTYEVGDKLVINENGVRTEISIIDRNYSSTTGLPQYTIANLDGTNQREITQDELENSFIEEYVETPTPAPNTATTPSESLTTGMENDPDVYASSVTEENGTEIKTEVIGDNHLGIRIHTFNGFEVGFGFDSTNKTIEYSGSKKGLNKRIDNGIGLARLMGYDLQNLTEDQYEEIKNALGFLKKNVYNKNNEELIELFKSLGIEHNDMKIQYAIKSSNPEESEGYERYYSDGKLDYIYSEAKDADKLSSKKLVLIVKTGNKPVFELTVGTLASPLTIMQELDENGKQVYKEFIDIYNQESSKTDNLHDIINVIISSLDNTNLPEYKYKQDLVNLFKLFQFNSNGIFYFGHYDNQGKFVNNYSFDLSKCISSGTVLTSTKGVLSLTGKHQYDGKLISITEFAKNPQFFVSSILMNKNHGKRIKPGYPFVLVSTDPDIITDNQIVDEYERNNPKVRMYYVVPPTTTIKDWFLNQRHNYDKIVSSNGTTQVKSLVGNEFTGYRILEALVNSNSLSRFTNFLSNDEKARTTFIEVVNRMKAIENKWNNSDIQFENNPIQGSYTDKDIYDQRMKLYKDHPDVDKIVRDQLITLEQLAYLNSLNNFEEGAVWGIHPNMTIKDAISKYLRNFVWNEFNNTGADQNVLNEINSICEQNGFKNILYKPFYSTTQVGSRSEYIKVVTLSGDNKYKILGSDGTPLDYSINAKIDPPSFLSEIIYQQINNITRSSSNWNSSTKVGNKHRTRSFYYDPHSKTWKLTSDTIKNSEDNYLEKESTDNSNQNTISVKDEIKRKYSKYFNNGILNESLIDENKNEIDNLNNLVSDYNSKPGRYGFISNGELYLTKFDPNIRITNVENNDILYGIDNNGVSYKFELFFERNETNGPITKVSVSQSKYTYIDQTNNSAFSGVTEDDFTKFKKRISDYNKENQFNSIGSYLEGINTLGELIQECKNIRSGESDIDSFILGVDNSSIEGNPFFEGYTNLIDKMLNYINSSENSEINDYTIVKYGNQRLYILPENKYVELGQNEVPDKNNISELINNRQIKELTDDIKSKLKIEEIQCSPISWNLLTKF